MQMVPIVQSHNGSVPGKPTVAAATNMPPPIPLMMNRNASRLGFRFVASTTDREIAPTVKDVHASGGVLGS